MESDMLDVAWNAISLLKEQQDIARDTEEVVGVNMKDALERPEEGPLTVLLTGVGNDVNRQDVQRQQLENHYVGNMKPYWLILNKP